MLKMLDPKSMNQCFTNWVMSLLPSNMGGGQTVSFDWKTVCSTTKMECYDNPLHIVSTHVSEPGLTLEQDTVEAMLDKKADYLLSVKDNQLTLKKDIENYIQDEQLRKDIKTVTRRERNRGRIETRTAFVTDDIAWLDPENRWKGLL